MASPKKKSKTGRKKKQSTSAPSQGAKQSKAITRNSLTGPLNAARSQHHASSCSILDPFCVHAKGARRPDGLGTQTMPYQVRQTVQIGTQATGQARTVFVPGYGIYGYAPASFSAGSNTLPATWTTFGAPSAFLTTNAAEVRIVSMGVRLVSVLSATNSQGAVILGTMSNPNVGHVQGDGRTTFPESSLRPLTSGFETTFISKPAGNAAHNFRPVTAITNNMSDFDWSALSVEITGGPANTICLIAEVVVNVEFTFLETQGGMTALIPPARPVNAVALQVQRQVQTSVPSIMDTTVATAGKFIEDKVASALPTIMNAAWAALPFF